jgi:hypothetical protein
MNTTLKVLYPKNETFYNIKITEDYASVIVYTESLENYKTLAYTDLENHYITNTGHIHSLMEIESLENNWEVKIFKIKLSNLI